MRSFRCSPQDSTIDVIASPQPVNKAQFEPDIAVPATKYGLPQHVVFCKRCVISNQRPNSAVKYAHTRDFEKKTIRSMRGVSATPAALPNARQAASTVPRPTGNCVTSAIATAAPMVAMIALCPAPAARTASTGLVASAHFSLSEINSSLRTTSPRPWPRVTSIRVPALARRRHCVNDAHFDPNFVGCNELYSLKSAPTHHIRRRRGVFCLPVWGVQAYKNRLGTTRTRTDCAL